MNKKQIGSLGEKYAADYLMSCDYIILAKNFSAKCGEIDIIARLEKTIVFVEVKTRKRFDFGTAAQAVDYKKQQKIIKTAQAYIICHNDETFSYRFDIIEVYYNNSGQYRLNHIKGAFEI